MESGPLGSKLQRVLLIACLAALFFSAVRLYSFAYFYVDDLNNLSLVQSRSGWEMIGYLLNPLENYYRPAGMLMYWVLFHSFGLSELPYHLMAWMLHGASSVLIFLILRKFVSEYAAAAGTMLFIFQTTYVDVLYNFGTVFELLAGFFFFGGLLIYLNWKSDRSSLLLFAGVYYLALASKEMAITLPALVLLHDCLVRPGRPDVAMWLRRLWLPGAIGVGLMILKLRAMAHSASDAPYYLDISMGTLLEGAVWYLNILGRSQYSGYFWLVVCSALAALLIAMRERRGMFFAAVVCLTFLPVIFLVNHRVPFYWYLPFLGVAGLAAVLVERAGAYLGSRLRFRHTWAAMPVFLILATAWHYQYQERLSRPEREWVLGLTREYRAFIAGLGSAVGSVKAGETIYFTSTPRYFDGNSIVSAARVTLGQPDLQAAIVPSPPPGAAYHVDFEQQLVQFRRLSFPAKPMTPAASPR